MGFVSKTPIRICLQDGQDPPVPEAEKDVVFIRPKMGYGSQERVRAAMAHITVNKARTAIQAHKAKEPQPDMELDVAEGNIILLLENIVRWQGPGFAEYPVPSRAAIEAWEEDDPLLTAVLTEINTRNAPKTAQEGTDAPDPLPSAATAG